MEYFSFKKSKKAQEKGPKTETPVLDEEDEAFLKRITAQVEGTPPALPNRPQDLLVAGDTEGNDMQLILADEAREIPLPDASETPKGVKPNTETAHETAANGKDKGHIRSKSKDKNTDDKKNRWSFLRRGSKAERQKSATAEGSEAKTENGEITKTEVQKEEEEMATVLEQLNLAAVSNRAFSLSKESQDLLKK